MGRGIGSRLVPEPRGNPLQHTARLRAGVVALSETRGLSRTLGVPLSGPPMGKRGHQLAEEGKGGLSKWGSGTDRCGMAPFPRLGLPMLFIASFCLLNTTYFVLLLFGGNVHYFYYMEGSVDFATLKREVFSGLSP